MNKHEKKYKEIVNNLIKENFHELEDKNIKIIEIPNIPILGLDSFAERGIRKTYIFMRKDRRGAPHESLKGQLAHELSHIVLQHHKKSFLGDFYHNIKKALSFILGTNFSRQIETKTDKETIKRGFGKEYLANAKEIEENLSEKELNRLYSKGYLRPKQIKEEMNKQK